MFSEQKIRRICCGSNYVRMKKVWLAVKVVFDRILFRRDIASFIVSHVAEWHHYSFMIFMLYIRRKCEVITAVTDRLWRHRSKVGPRTEDSVQLFWKLTDIFKIQPTANALFLIFQMPQFHWPTSFYDQRSPVFVSRQLKPKYELLPDKGIRVVLKSQNWAHNMLFQATNMFLVDV